MSAADRRDDIAEDRNRGVQGRERRARADWCDPDRPGDERAQADGDHPAGNSSLEPDTAEVGEYDDPEGCQSDQRARKGAEEKTERDERKRDSGERREKCGPRRDLSDT